MYQKVLYKILVYFCVFNTIYFQIFGEITERVLIALTCDYMVHWIYNITNSLYK